MPPAKKKATQRSTNTKKSKPSVTSTPLRSKVVAKTSQTRREETRRKSQANARTQHIYSVGVSDLDTNTHIYKFTGKQTKGWRQIDKPLKEYLSHLIDGGVRSVSSKTAFVDDEGIQELLNDLKLRLKSKLHTIKVPNRKYGDYSKLKATLTSLKEEADDLTTQELALEKEIRHEERQTEQLEDGDMMDNEAGVELCIQVPDNQLNLPGMGFS